MVAHYCAFLPPFDILIHSVNRPSARRKLITSFSDCVRSIDTILASWTHWFSAPDVELSVASVRSAQQCCASVYRTMRMYLPFLSGRRGSAREIKQNRNWRTGILWCIFWQIRCLLRFPVSASLRTRSPLWFISDGRLNDAIGSHPFIWWFAFATRESVQCSVQRCVHRHFQSGHITYNYCIYFWRTEWGELTRFDLYKHSQTLRCGVEHGQLNAWTARDIYREQHHLINLSYRPLHAGWFGSPRKSLILCSWCGNETNGAQRFFVFFFCGRTR